MGFSIIGWLLMAKQRFIALFVFIIANSVWLIWSTNSKIYSLAILQLFFIFLNIRTIISWTKSEKEKDISNQEKSYRILNQFFRKKTTSE